MRLAPRSVKNQHALWSQAPRRQRFTLAVVPHTSLRLAASDQHKLDQAHAEALRHEGHDLHTQQRRESTSGS